MLVSGQLCRLLMDNSFINFLNENRGVFEMVKIRLQGLPAEVERMILSLREKGYRILSESTQYQNRNSEYVRVYLDVKISKQT
ncbi:hypothetical protein SAMN05660649_04309 [Desulfotomaculum arcticum]|uniref:Uncharacterized protein n=2 Tax=Desulfotruncus TaxID=2867377 RepID=A0A1I2Y8S7_9FIRM|nr:hypothetical protein SAMN05660649_04309 [Desulfotomaculum arcticum] [Desulfotruncus arcticus DSM 17038]